MTDELINHVIRAKTFERRLFNFDSDLIKWAFKG